MGNDEVQFSLKNKEKLNFLKTTFTYQKTTFTYQYDYVYLPDPKNKRLRLLTQNAGSRQRLHHLTFCSFLNIINIGKGEREVMETKEMNTNISYTVAMHNDLIKSKSSLSLNEIKLLRLAIMQVIKGDTDFQVYQVRVVDLAETLNISRQAIYQEVDKMTTNLLREIVYVGDGNPKHKWKKFQWCSCCEYEDGVLTIKLHNNLKPYLLNLSQYYTQYVLEDIILLKSVYSIRIYELIREAMKYHQVYADKEADVYLDIDTIRKATDTEDKYERMNSFITRVIDIAVNEINQKLNYHITYKPRKDGKKFIGFDFNIKSKGYAKLLELGLNPNLKFRGIEK